MRTEPTRTKRGASWPVAALLALIPLMALWIVPTAGADEMGDLRASFKARFKKLQALQNSGDIGETFDGWVGLVKDGNAEAVEVVNAENADRRKLYELIAKKQNTTPALVATRNGVRNFTNAAPHHYVKLKNGNWVQKKDVKE